MILFIKLKEVLLLYAIITETICFDYCHITTCPTGEHTMCKYQTESIACPADGEGKFPDDTKRAILKRHNKHRQSVALGQFAPQPSASNMMKLTWNNEAARVAQRWANQCVFLHDSCRKLEHYDVNQNGVSQKVPVSSSEMDSGSLKAKLLAMVDEWLNEGKTFDKNQVGRFQYKMSSSQLGYAQLVWAETTSVGCGLIVKATYTDQGHNYRNITLFCNYVVSGIYENKPVYKKGMPCSKCPAGAGCSKEYPGLCTFDKSDFGGDPKALYAGGGKGSENKCVPSDVDRAGGNLDSVNKNIAITPELSVLGLIFLVLRVFRGHLIFLHYD